MRKLTLMTLALLVCGAAGWNALAARRQEPNAVGDFMQAKLKHAQKTLEAIALEEFKEIAHHSQEMSLLSQEENWRVFQTPEYLQHSQEFRRHCDDMHEAAEKKNLDGAALAYMQMTMSCVNCHKYVRSARLADVSDLEAFQGLGQ